MKSRRFACICVLALANVIASPAVAGTPRGLQERGSASAVVADGDRWLILGRAAGATAVNTVIGQRRRLTFGVGCAPRSAHRGLLLITCPAPTPGATPGGPNTTYTKPYITGLSTGRTTGVPNDVLSSIDAFASPDPGWTTVGTRWIAGQLGCYRCEDSTSYINWRTGERRQSNDNIPRDLDDPQLRPLRRAGGPRVLPQVAFRPGGSMTVRIDARIVTLSRCPTGCSTPVIAADRYAWLEDNLVRGYVPATNQRVDWRLPPRTNNTLTQGPYLTRNRVTVHPKTRNTNTADGQVLTATWPTTRK